MQQLEADYLVIGTGALGMAFVDTVLSENENATFIMVDRHALPGGHWNDAYPFVRLHQPSSFYGVPSTPLGSDLIDQAGSNKGFQELASGPEVLAYFDRVMRDRFLPSGRVRHFAMSDVTSRDGKTVKFRSMLSDSEYEVQANARVIDATYFNTSVPSTHARKFAVADGINIVTPNQLPKAAHGFKKFCIIGAGKTGMDSGVWLLDNGADADSISWVCPRTSWLINRTTTQPTREFFKTTIGGFADQMEASAKAASVDDLFARMEEKKSMIRIHDDGPATMFHYATIAEGEVAQLKRIKNMLRQGRIDRIEDDKIVFQSGDTAPASPDTLYIDCTATAVEYMAEGVSIFTDDLITIQSVRTPNLTFSAALVGYVEANYDDIAKKNSLAMPVTIADTPREWMQSFLGNMMNQFNWRTDETLMGWMMGCRLEPFGKLMMSADMSDPVEAEIVERMKEMGPLAMANLNKLISESA